jgi:hypothetical protein
MINRILIWIALAFSVVALGIAIQHGSVPSATPAHRLGASNQCFVNDPTTQGLLGFPTLTSAVTTAVQSTIQVSSTAAFAQCVGRTFQVRIDNEVLVVTGAVGLTLSVIRGADNSIPTLHSVGAMVSGVITAGGLSALNPFAALDGGAGNLLTLFDGGTYGWQSPIPLPGNVLAVYPIDGVSDDWATLMNVTIPAAIAAGQWVMLMPGPAGQQWQVKTLQSTPNHTRLAIHQNAIVNVSLTPNGSSSVPFFSSVAYGTQGASVGATAAGATIITTNFTVVPGTWLQIAPGASSSYGNLALTRQVSSSAVNGSNYNLTLTQPLSRPMPSGASVSQLTFVPNDIVVAGNNALITGTGDGCVNINGGLNSHFIGLNCSVSSGSTPYDIDFLADTASSDISFERSTATVANGLSEGFRLAGVERGVVTGCTSVGAIYGISINDSVASRAEHSYVTNGTIGVFVFTDGAVNPPYSGSLDCVIDDIQIDGMTQNAYTEYTSNTVFNQRVSDVRATYVNTSGGGNYPAFDSWCGTSFDHLALSNTPGDSTGSVGIRVLGTGASLRDSSITGFTYGIDQKGVGTILENVQVTSPYENGLLSETGSVSAKNLAISGVLDALNGSSVYSLGGTVLLDHATLSGAVYGLRVLGGYVRLADTTISGFQYLGIKSDESTGSVRIGSGNTYSSVSPGQLSRGTVTLNGTTSVNVAFPSMLANDLVNLTLKTVGGTLGSPIVTQTAGTGFSVKSTNASDTSTYAYAIE